MRARWLLGGALALVACAGSPKSGQQQQQPAPPTTIVVDAAAPPPAPAPVSAVAPAQRAPLVTVLHRGKTPADLVRQGPMVHTLLLGVETTRERAWLNRSISGGGKKAYELAHVPLSATAPDAAPLERWTATPKNADQRAGSAFQPLTGTVEADVARYARIIESFGPRSTTNDRQLAVSRDHILYEDGDHLTLRDRDGKKPRYFSRGVQSAYAPVLSPDGQTAAFTGCDGAIAARGRTLPEIQACYALYISPLAGPPVRIADVSEFTAPVFSADGRFVYATSSVRSKPAANHIAGGCLHRVDAAPPYARTKLHCATADGALAFALAADAKTVVVAATEREPELSVEYTWLGLPDGKVLGSVKIPRASSFGFTVGSNGLLVTPAAGGVVVADAKGTVRIVPGMDQGFVSVAAQWDGERVYAVRKTEPDVEEILLIDTRAVLETPAPP